MHVSFYLQIVESRTNLSDKKYCELVRDFTYTVY